MTYRTAAIAAVLAAAAASTVAHAADRAPTPAPAGDNAASAKIQSNAPKRYCIRPGSPGAEPLTGSHIPLSGCRTRAQWEALGVSLSDD